MAYVVVELRANDQTRREALRFISRDAACTALATFIDGKEEVTTLTSDSGELLRVRRSHVVRSYLASAAPPCGDPEPADIESLRAKLGPPIYDGPNGLVVSVSHDALSVTAGIPDDDITLWLCQRQPTVQTCLAERRAGAEWRYWPCSIHRELTR